MHHNDGIDDFDEEWEGEEFEMQLPKRGPIHQAFFPFDSKKRFVECTMCKKELGEETDFLIEKAIKGTDVIFEIAICVPCAENMNKQLSVDSKARIEDYMGQIDFEARALHFINNPTDDIEDYIGHCIISGKQIEPLEEHQIYTHCTGDTMLYSALPYALGATALEEIQELLSPETKQEMDDFMDTYLIPDDLRDLLKGRPIFV